MDGDIESLVEILDVANKGHDPRITKNILDAYIDDETTDIDELFGKVMDFLSNANATKNTVKNLRTAIELQKNQ